MIAVLFSGGIDSLIHLRWAMDRFGRYSVQPIYFDVGQGYAEREKDHARILSRIYGYTLLEKTLEDLTEVKATGQIPLRNLKFILDVAADPIYSGVVFGMLLAEAPVDKSPYFVGLVQKLLDSQFRPSVYDPKGREFTIYTPFSTYTKTQMIKWLKKNYAYGDLSLLRETVACYTTGQVMCGECISCFNRWLAFKGAGVQDATYEIDPALGMLRRVVEVLQGRNTKDKAAFGFGPAWRRRKWLWETYKALNQYTKEHYKCGVLAYLWDRRKCVSI